MKRKFIVLLIFTVSMILILSACSDTDEATGNMTSAAKKLGITEENYPRIDGSTSALPIIQEIYKAMYKPDADTDRFPENAFQTILSYECLIDGTLDLIIVPDPSAEIVQLAKDRGVELEYIPICSEALIFIVNEQTQIDGLTTEQIKSVYTYTDRKVIQWSQLGDETNKDMGIMAYCRNADSGSQALMDKFVLKGEEILEEIQTNSMILAMAAVVDEVNFITSNNIHIDKDMLPLAYTLYYYFQNNKDSKEWDAVKILDIDGVKPTPETISSGEYPYSTHYYAVIRKDTPEKDVSRKLISWLQSKQGKEAIKKAGFGI